jgi:hypothetical protein
MADVLGLAIALSLGVAIGADDDDEGIGDCALAVVLELSLLPQAASDRASAPVAIAALRVRTWVMGSAFRVVVRVVVRGCGAGLLCEIWSGVVLSCDRRGGSRGGDWGDRGQVPVVR